MGSVVSAAGSGWAGTGFSVASIGVAWFADVCRVTERENRSEVLTVQELTVSLSRRAASRSNFSFLNRNGVGNSLFGVAE